MKGWEERKSDETESLVSRRSTTATSCWVTIFHVIPTSASSANERERVFFVLWDKMQKDEDTDIHIDCYQRKGHNRCQSNSQISQVMPFRLRMADKYIQKSWERRRARRKALLCERRFFFLSSRSIFQTRHSTPLRHSVYKADLENI